MWVNPQVAAVEQGVYVGAEQEAVVDPVLAVVGYGTDVRCLQDRTILLPVTAQRRP